MLILTDVVNAGSTLRDWIKWFVPYIAYLSLFISVVALATPARDRRPRLLVLVRKGKWITWHGNMLVGIIEVCNRSARSNTIIGYRFATIDERGNSVGLESEQYKELEEDGTEITFNDTPVVLGPYTGAAVRFGCFGEWHKQPRDMKLLVTVEDLFGRCHSAQVAVLNRHSKRQS